MRIIDFPLENPLSVHQKATWDSRAFAYVWSIIELVRRMDEVFHHTVFAAKSKRADDVYI